MRLDRLAEIFGFLSTAQPCANSYNAYHRHDSSRFFTARLGNLAYNSEVVDAVCSVPEIDRYIAGPLSLGLRRHSDWASLIGDSSDFDALRLDRISD